MKSKHVFNREGVEWTHLLWEKAPDSQSARIAVIGDSITFNYRDEVQSILGEHGVCVDMLAGSRCAGDPALDAELEYFFGDTCGYKYDVIHFNNGLHGECNNIKIPNNVYAVGIERCIDVIRRLQPQATIILATSTHLSEEGVHGVLDLERNKVMMERNDIVRQIAEKNGLAISDLFTIVAGNADYPQLDGVHFGPEGVKALARAVADICLSALGNKAAGKAPLPSLREDTEWTRFWWADANDIEKPRIAIVGDLNSLGYYQSVQDNVWNENVRICSSIGSRTVCDPALCGELEYFFGPACGYKYEIIYIDTLTNGITVDGKGHTVQKENYKLGVENILRTLRRLQPDARLIFSVLDDNADESEKALFSSEVLDIMRERSDILRDLDDYYGFETHPIFPVIAGATVPPYGFRYESDLPQMTRMRNDVTAFAHGLSDAGKKVDASAAASADEMIPNKAY